MSLAEAIRRRLTAAHHARLGPDAIAHRLAQRRGALILCYHSVSHALAGYDYATAPDAFRSHLGFLKQVFELLPLRTALDRMTSGELAGDTRPVAVLTFDDGFRDNLSTVTPILEAEDVPATLFAPRDLIRRGGSTHMTEDDLKALADHPLWEIGAHGVTHNVLTSFTPEDRRRELSECRDWLSDLLGRAPAGFAYPLGRCNAEVCADTATLYDHALATGTRPGARFDRFAIRRLCPSSAEDPTEAFARALLTAPMEDGRS